MVDRASTDVNLRPTLQVVSNGDNATPVNLWADPVTHGLVLGSVIATPAVTANLYNNQQTVTTLAAPLASQALTQGITVEALSSNTVSVFVGNSSLTTANGIELPPGAAVILPVNNANLVYVICASTSPVVSWAAV